MKILITNDDGIHARGLKVLTEVCREVAQVTVVAPDREQSGASHSLTLHRPLRPLCTEPDTYQVDGTPTDCVLLALGKLLPEKPDFVFSGINHGPNMGEDVLYSGTVAGAMEGLSLGIPGVAFSLGGGNALLLDSFRTKLRHIVEGILALDDFPADMLLNINLPGIPGDEVRGVRTTTLGKRVYSESLAETSDPWGRTVYWIGGGQISWSGREDCDFRAVRDGHISITPLHVDLTNYTSLDIVTKWELGG
ncbi:MAG: 5'/3'-nucleotidase SurE [Gemmatimonadales bacterium]